MCRCHLPLAQVLDELPMAVGWTLIAWSLENDPWLAVERATPGYIAQEPLTTNL